MKKSGSHQVGEPVSVLRKKPQNVSRSEKSRERANRQVGERKRHGGWAYGRGRRKTYLDRSLGYCNQGETNLMASDKEERAVCKIPEFIKAASP